MNKNIALIISILAFGIAVFSQVRLSSLSAENQELKKQLTDMNSSGEEEEGEYELAVVMSRMQIYFHKLWFAGKNENWELANFYTHELEESIEELIEHNVEDDGVNVSNLAKIMTETPFHNLEKSVKAGVLADFETSYQNMMQTCNQCHQASGHGFIQLQIPQNVAFDNQIFEKKN